MYECIVYKNVYSKSIFLVCFGVYEIKKKYNLLIRLYFTHTYRIIQPQCLGGLVTYFSPGENDITKNDAYLYATGIVLCSLISITVFHPFILYAFQLGMRVRLTCCSLIYKKVTIKTES